MARVHAVFNGRRNTKSIQKAQGAFPVKRQPNFKLETEFSTECFPRIRYCPNHQISKLLLQRTRRSEKFTRVICLHEPVTPISDELMRTRSAYSSTKPVNKHHSRHGCNGSSFFDHPRYPRAKVLKFISQHQKRVGLEMWKNFGGFVASNWQK